MTIVASVESKRKALAALTEIRKRERIVEAMRGDSFPEQWEFVIDESKLHCAFTTRRGGKSSAFALKYLRRGILTPGCSMLYTGLTDDSAWRILWKDALKPMGKRYGINLKPLKAEKAVQFIDYGSMLYFLGIENSEEEMAKAYGQKYTLCGVDEGAKYRQDIKVLIYDVLLPAVADYDGSVFIAGMPAQNPNQTFYDITVGDDPGWRRHEWTWEQNPHVREKMRQHLDFLIGKNPKIVDTPGFKMSYGVNGRPVWAVATDKRIYNFDVERNSYDDLPTGSVWYYVLGVDLGYNPDPSAFVILAYRDYDPCLYVVDVFSQRNMDLTAVADRIKFYYQIYPINKTIIDAGHKQGVEELKQRHDLQLTPAEKAGKADFMQLCNDDLKHGRVKVKSSDCEPLIKEWAVLIWDERARAKGVFAEPPRAKNHCFAAGTMVRTSTGEVPIEKIKIGDRVWTRKGLRPVVRTFENGVRKIVRAEFSNGSVLFGTPDHKIWTDSGWKKLRALTQYDTLVAWGSTEKTKLSNTAVSAIEGIQTPKIEISAYTSNRSGGAAYTGLFGKIITKRNSQERCTFIIETATRSTTQSTILLPLMAASTYGNTPCGLIGLSDLGNLLKKHGQRQMLGINLRMGSHGIASTQKRFGEDKNPLSILAGFVVRSLKQKLNAQPFVAKNATQSGEGSQESTILSSVAQNAGRYLNETDTQKPSIVPCHVLRLEPVGSALVYDLTVAGEHEYFANGILVSNCADAFLYAWRYCYNWVDRGLKIKSNLSVDEKMDQFWADEQNRMTGLDPLGTLARQLGYNE